MNKAWKNAEEGKKKNTGKKEKKEVLAIQESKIMKTQEDEDHVP